MQSSTPATESHDSVSYGLENADVRRCIDHFQFDAAIELCSHVSAMKSQFVDPSATIAVVECLILQNRYEAAVECIRACPQRQCCSETEQDRLTYLEAFALFKLEKFSQAELALSPEAFTTASSVSDRLVPAGEFGWKLLGDIIGSDRAEEASFCYRKCLSINPMMLPALEKLCELIGSNDAVEVYLQGKEVDGMGIETLTTPVGKVAIDDSVLDLPLNVHSVISPIEEDSGRFSDKDHSEAPDSIRSTDLPHTNLTNENSSIFKTPQSSIGIGSIPAAPNATRKNKRLEMRRSRLDMEMSGDFSSISIYESNQSSFKHKSGPSPLYASVIKPNHSIFNPGLVLSKNPVARYAPLALASNHLGAFRFREVINLLSGLMQVQCRSNYALIRSPKAYELLGRALHGDARYEEAIRVFYQMQDKFPFYVRGLHILAKCLWIEKRSNELSHLANRMRRIAPNSKEAFIASGLTFSLINEHSTAIENFRRATEVAPRCPVSFTLLGQEYVELSNYSEAIGAFRRALHNSPRYFQAWLGLGNVHQRQEQHSQALLHIQRAVQLNPHSCILQTHLGMALRAAGYRKEALEALRRAVELDNTSALALLQKGTVLWELDRVHGAMIDFGKVLQLQPHEAGVHVVIAQAFLNAGSGGSNGNDGKALHHLTVALDLDPTHELGLGLLDTLNSE